MCQQQQPVVHSGQPYWSSVYTLIYDVTHSRHASAFCRETKSYREESWYQSNISPVFVPLFTHADRLWRNARLQALSSIGEELGDDFCGKGVHKTVRFIFQYSNTITCSEIASMVLFCVASYNNRGNAQRVVQIIIIHTIDTCS